MASKHALHLLRLELDAAHIARLSKRMKMPRNQGDLGYPLHAILSELFGKGVAQPYRAREQGGRRLSLLAYTHSPESELREHAQTYADPSIYASCDWTTFAAKAMPEAWPEGRRLGFELRACPVVRLAQDLVQQDHTATKTYRRGSELDAWQHRRWISGEPEEISREDAYRDWLVGRLDGAATLEALNLAGFQRVRLARKRNQNGETRWTILERPEATLHGQLVIQDGEAFAELLARGVGRHAAFGFGMLLLRPPGSQR